MSWRHIEASIKVDVDATTHAILVCLCHHANEFTCRCWPSLERIERFTKFKRRSIQMAIQKLESRGLVEVRRGSNRTSSNYLLKLPGCEPISQAHGASDDKSGEQFDREADEDGRNHGVSDDVHGASGDIHGAGDAPKETREREGNGRTRASSAKVQVPSDWWPTDEQLSKAKKEFPDVDIDRETRQFVRKNLAQGTEFANIGAGWEAWIARGAGFAERDRRNGSRFRGHGQAPSSVDFLRQERPPVHHEERDRPVDAQRRIASS